MPYKWKGKTLLLDMPYKSLMHTLHLYYCCHLLFVCVAIALMDQSPPRDCILKNVLSAQNFYWCQCLCMRQMQNQSVDKGSMIWIMNENSALKSYCGIHIENLHNGVMFTCVLGKNADFCLWMTVWQAQMHVYAGTMVHAYTFVGLFPQPTVP